MSTAALDIEKCFEKVVVVKPWLPTDLDVRTRQISHVINLQGSPFAVLFREEVIPMPNGVGLPAFSIGEHFGRAALGALTENMQAAYDQIHNLSLELTFDEFTKWLEEYLEDGPKVAPSARGLEIKAAQYRKCIL